MSPPGRTSNCFGAIDLRLDGDPELPSCRTYDLQVFLGVPPQVRRPLHVDADRPAARAKGNDAPHLRFVLKLEILGIALSRTVLWRV